VSAPNHTPGPAPFSWKIGWINFICLVFFFGAIAGVLVWGLFGAPFGSSDDDGSPYDDSIVVDHRFKTPKGEVAEAGRIYLQAQLALAPETELVLPVTPADRISLSPKLDVEVRTKGPPNTLRVLTETYIDIRSGRPIRLSAYSKGTGVWKRQHDSVLVIGVDPGWMNIRAGGEAVRAVFVIPPGQRVRQEESASPEFVSRYKGFETPWVISDDKSREAGWERVPMQPLPHDQFR
jgi:hypothetical protein